MKTCKAGVQGRGAVRFGREKAEKPRDIMRETGRDTMGVGLAPLFLGGLKSDVHSHPCRIGIAPVILRILGIGGAF